MKLSIGGALNILREYPRAAPGRNGVRPLSVRLLSDEPVNDPANDYFGFASFANALAEIVDDESTDTPLTIAVSAPWGAGKTSVAGMMERLLLGWVAERYGDRPRVVCSFDAWEHDDAPHLGAALAATVARTASHERRWWWRLIQPLPAAMLGPQERWWRSIKIAVAALVAAVALTAVNFTQKLTEELFNVSPRFVSGLGWFGALLLIALVWRRVLPAARDAAQFVDDPRSEAAKGSMAQVKDQLGHLIRQATRGGRLVIFVDDLERCRPARAVEVFEVASQLLAHPGVVTVLLADMRALSDAARAAYADGAMNADADLGRPYLEKLVQLALELPPPAKVDMERLLRGAPPNGQASQSGSVSLTASPPQPPINWERVALLAVYATCFGIVCAVVFVLSGGTTGISALVAEVATVSAVLGVLVAVFAIVARALGRSRQLRFEQELRTRGLGDPPLSSTVTDRRLKSYASRAEESFRAERSSEIQEVERFIQRYPPRFPRGAKRVLNHTRLLTKIAREREMFGGTPQLTPVHLGKWIVLRERWPRLAEHIAANPSEMWAIESGKYASLAGFGVDEDDVELRALLSEPPRLGGVMVRLIHYEPASPRTAPPDDAVP
jgi:hypothetical protein